MAELKIKIPEELKKKIEKLGIDWSPAVRRMIEKEIQNLGEIEKIVSKSKMSDEDALEIGKKISKSIAEKFKSMLLVTDANVVLGSLVAKGGNFKVFAANKILRKHHFVAPEYLFIEVHEHFDEIAEKSKLSSEELNIILDFLEEQIEIIPFLFCTCIEIKLRNLVK